MSENHKHRNLFLPPSVWSLQLPQIQWLQCLMFMKMTWISCLRGIYPLVNYHSYWTWPCFGHYTWGFSIVMLLYQNPTVPNTFWDCLWSCFLGSKHLLRGYNCSTRGGYPVFKHPHLNKKNAPFPWWANLLLDFSISSADLLTNLADLRTWCIYIIYLRYVCLCVFVCVCVNRLLKINI